MKVILIRAIRNLFVEQIELKPQPFRVEDLNGTHYVSSIELKSEKDKENNIFKIFLSEDLLKKVCSVLLFEDEPDTETLEDMGTEVANQIIGNAKVLVESVKQEVLKLSIPKVERGIKLEEIIAKKSTVKILFKFNENEKIWFLLSKETIKD